MMDLHRGLSPFDGLQSKIAAAIDDFEAAFQSAVDQETFAANEKLGASTHALIHALALVLILLE
jgi:hypothetical protein